MSLDIPELDETNYEELVSNAKNRIAARTDEWTDFNPHDPGITILELLAWLTDTQIYELDQLTEAHRKKYLQLVGIKPTPPQPASVSLSVSPPNGGGRLPAGTRLRADDVDHQLLFETDHPLHVTESTITAVVVNGDSKTTANETDGMSYRLFGDNPTAGDWFAVGFDGDPFDSGPLQLLVDLDDSELPEPPADEAQLFEPSVELSWEYHQPNPQNGEQWEPLAVREETTNSLYERGYITLERPDSWEPSVFDSDETSRVTRRLGAVWIRCRLTEGGYEIPPKCRAIQTNVVTASHRSRHTQQLTPVDNRPAGGAPRSYQFEHSPVLSATVTVDGEQWTEVEDFDASGPTDCHYVLDRTAGELTVGDGQRGLQPPAGASLHASYEAGGGTVGNVSADARWSVDDESDTVPAVELEPMGPATGGTDAESVEAAIERCRSDRSSTQRAVTVDDYGRLAKSTPGVRVARSNVILPAAAEEAISVVVVPYAPPDVQRPTPSDGFRRAVETHLDRHRLLGDRIEVRAPNYVELRVDVSVVSTTDHTAEETSAEIERQLRSFLDPIDGYDGDGWPFGRSISEGEIHETLSELSTVDTVESVTVRATGDTTVTTDRRVLIDEATQFVLGSLDVACRGGSD